MYLKYISNNAIDRFVKAQFCSNARTIMVDDEERTYVNVFTNLLDTTLHINDFECINMDIDREYHKSWRKFMVNQLDAIDPSKKLGNRYINDLHRHLENCTICGQNR